MNQIEKIIKDCKIYLNGRSIVDDRKSKEVYLTEDEMVLIFHFISLHASTNYTVPTINPISAENLIDFIGWDDDRYRDVLISTRWRKKRKKAVLKA